MTPDRIRECEEVLLELDEADGRLKQILADLIGTVKDLTRRVEQAEEQTRPRVLGGR